MNTDIGGLMMRAVAAISTQLCERLGIVPAFSSISLRSVGQETPGRSQNAKERFWSEISLKVCCTLASPESGAFAG
jgi:hypothetical protein